MILKSGSVLEVNAAPFAQARALFAAVSEELKELKIVGSTEMDFNFLKDILCASVCSKKIESALEECLKRCTYNGLKIVPADTFEPIKAREDYLEVCLEVAKANLMPFMKNLYAQYADVFQKITANVPV